MSTFSPAYGYYDVTAYGALGNGTHDDAPNIRSAETACEATGGVVYFPPGNYLIKSTIPIAASNVTWRGAGAAASTITLDASAGTTTPMVTVAANIDNIIFTNLRFQGNNLNTGTGGAPGADAITFGTSGGAINHFCKVEDCFFTLTTAGATLHFWETTDGEVSGCHFYQVGHDNGTTSDANVTPAVLIEPGSVNVRVHNNHFEACYYDGVRVRGTACEVSYNYFKSCHGSGIDVGNSSGAGDGVRIFGNYLDATTQVGTGVSQGINLLVVEDFQLIGNSVTGSDGNGIRSDTCTSGAFVGNLCSNNSSKSSAGDSGMYYSAGTTGLNPNKGIVYVGNVCFDDQGTPTQKYGVHFAASGGAATESSLVGNAFWGNVTTDVEIDSTVLVDDSAVAIANTSWLDRQHLTSYPFTGGTTKLPLFNANLTFAANSMRTTNGLRVVASGTTAGGANKAARTFYLGLNLSGNLMTYTSSSSDTDWQLLAYIMNNAAFAHQRSFIQFWFGGILVYHASATTSVHTESTTTLLLEAQLTNSADMINADFLSVERV